MDSVLIVAASGRALAASARRAGYRPLVIDWFGDADTLALADAHARIDGLRHGFTRDALDVALAAVTAEHHPLGVVYGTGFEDRPALVGHLAERLPLLGNGPETVERTKDPVAFASICSQCGIAHPEISLAHPQDPSGWIAKRIGGAGGSHIRSATETAPSRGYYFQREAPGIAVSAQLLANGKSARVLGFSEQWPAPARHQPFRYGGAVRPASISATMADVLTDAACRAAAATQLTGLNSADFLVEGDNFRLLEINPRSGATLDIFEPPGGSLFALHMSACAGALESDAPSLAGAAATATVYAERDVSIPEIDWPDWTADRPHAGTAIGAGEPLCTVKASGATAAEARQRVEERRAAVLTWTHARMR